MATTATTTTVDPDRPPHLRLDSIPTVDLHLLSQSELYSLSKCSNSSFDLNRCDDVVIPKIDRSVFNESAGSRKQTYSRLRLAPAVTSTSSPTTIHRRTPHLRPSITPILNNVNDTEQVENSQIIHALKQLFKSNPSFDDYVAVEVEIDGNGGVFESLKATEVGNDGNGVNEVALELSNSVEVKTEGNVALLNSEMKRKRGRPRKHEKAVFIKPPVRKRRRRMHNDTVMKVVVYDSEMDKELVNCRGVKVDMQNLGKLEDPYGPEIRKRTEGLLTSDELLGFLRGLKGEWGTTRKKRRVVDASDFGDALPKGWRLSLCIKRKGGRVWVFCRRYISPSGRYFESCKDVSIYLLSVVGEENLDKPTCTPVNDCDEPALKGALGNAPDVYVWEDLKMDIPVPESSNPIEVEKDGNVIVPEPLNSIEVENDGNVVVPELSNSEMRRKRGRPRKHENAVFVSPPVRKRMRNDTVKKVVVYDSDIDREIVNCKGVKVDLVNLGRLEDPYGPEIGRRTEGMLSADELLGFLRGLNGEWGTTRKKRRVVEASDFGDALPKGWRLSLCIKRKDGRVWVFCRRYISPSGRQFESCKDVSMYLLSVVGEENLDKPTCAHNDHDDSALKGASENDADLFVREDLKTNDPAIESLNLMEGEKDRKIVVPESLNPIEVEIGGNVVPELSNSERRRKRGRPRKNENAVSVSPLVTKRMHNDTVKKAVVYDTDKDREIVNCRGAKVNLVNFGRLEDPYGPEIRMRTEGMLTADELLGFLRGLNGEWGTTRKKRRVVDASDFGDALPKGWRLSLCIKKKDGRVWLFCRRYISPSGRQFESCKDISGYLLSIVGEENLDKPSSAPSNDSDDSAIKIASGNAADIYVRKDLKRNIPVHSSSALPISLPTGFENQVTSDIGDHVVAQEVYKCLKCFMIFAGKIDLLDHQALAHKNEGSQSGSEIPDWSIVIGGIFECKLCRKTFYEKNQYNGHIGMHVTNESKTSEASVALAAEKTFDTVSIAGVRNDATETHDAHFSDKLITASSQSDHKIVSGTESKIEEVVHDLNMDGDVLVEESGDDIGNNCNVDDNASDVLVVKSDDRVGNNCNAVDDNDSVVKSDFCLGHEASISSVNEINGKFRSSGRAIDAVDAKSECMSGVQTIIVREEKGFRENINDTHFCSSSDKLASEKEKAVNTESSSGVFHGHIGLDEYCLAESEKVSDSESLSLFSPSKDRFKTVNGSMIPSKSQESPQKIGFDATVDQVTHGFDENRFSYGISTSKHDDPYKIRSSTLDYYQQNEHVNKEKFHIQNDVNNASLNKSGGVNLDSFYNFKNNGSINNKVASFRSSQNGLNAGVTHFNTEKQLNISPPVPSGNQQAFDFQDDVTGLYDSAHGSSQKGLLDHFCVAETSDDIFGNKVYSTPLDGLKFDEGIHELSLAFGNPHPHALYADKMNANEQKKEGVNCSVVPSKIENPFDVQTDLSMVNNSMVQDLKRGSESVGRSFSLSRNSESRAFQHNGNIGYSGRTWEDPQLDEFRSSDHNKFMMGSGSNHHHHNEAGPSDIWKSAERNQLQSGFVNPHAQTQSQSQSPSFHSFDIMSAKAEDGVFRLDERYNGGMSVGRSEPVEFRFLAGRSEHNPHALQGSSRVLPYNNRMEQAFDSNFWMGNNGMMPNMGGRNVVTSVCAWCRNQFQMPAMAMHPESQGGAGCLCPTCSAGFSGQVNML